MLELTESDKAKMFDILASNRVEVYLTAGMWKVFRPLGDIEPAAIGKTWLGAVSDFCRVIQEKREADG